MSYCRFQNTYQDLKDCIESIEYRTDIKDLPAMEKKYALKLRELCEEYLELSEVEEEEEEIDFCPKYIENVIKNLMELQTIPAIDEALERLDKTEVSYSNFEKLKEEND